MDDTMTLAMLAFATLVSAGAALWQAGHAWALKAELEDLLEDVDATDMYLIRLCGWMKRNGAKEYLPVVSSLERHIQYGVTEDAWTQGT